MRFADFHGGPITHYNRRVVFSTHPEPEQSTAPLEGNAAAPAAGARRAGTQGTRGNTVSLVTGVIGVPAELEKLCKLLKNRLGTGGAVKAQIIEIQGDQRVEDRRYPSGAWLSSQEGGG